MKRTTKLSIVLAAALSLPGFAQAGELRILDSHGLVRATAEVKREAAVVVTLSAPLSQGKVQLMNVNGIAPDITGSPEGETVRFSGVPEGVWRVTVQPPSVAVRKIEIR